MSDFTRHIPPEILTEVFKWLHASALESFGPAPVDGGRVFELCLPVSVVCKYWREVALVAPFLWTYLPRITVRDDYENPMSKEDTEPFLATLKVLISRAPNATLHPSFTCTATAIEGPHMSEVTTYLISRCSEWGSVSIRGVVDSIALFFWEIDIPCLEALRLEFLEGDEEPDGTDLPMFEYAPMLKSVHISGTYEWNLELDARSLVYLYDGVGGIIHNITVSDGFPQLTTLEIHDHGFFDFTNLMEEDFTLVLPALRKLIYRCDDTMNSDEGFLSFPVAPLLEEALIVSPEGDVLANILSMCDRSESTLPLKSLRVLEDPLEECFDGQLADLLQYLPDLEMLEIAFPDEDDIDLLAVSRGDEILVPRLKKCSFEYHADNFDGLNEPVQKLIAARCEPSATKEKSADEGLATMELIFSNSLWSFRLSGRIMPGFADGQYGYLGIQPTRMEPWYGDREVQRSAYTYAAHTIPQMLFELSHSQIDVNSFDFKHSLELIAKVEQTYKANDLVDFLASHPNRLKTDS